MSVVLSGLVVVLIACAAAGLLVFGVQKLTPQDKPEAHIEATGFVFAVVGVLYAIVLAFIVIAVWDQMTQAREGTYREATALVDTYWYAQSLPDDQRAQVQQLCREYADLVIKDEWPRMEAHERVGMAGWAKLDEIRAIVDKDENDDGNVAEIYAARDARVGVATTGLSPVLWFVLTGGGILTVAFAYLFDVGGPIIQAVLAVGLTAMVALLVFAVFQLEYPFGRGVHIAPEAFEFALRRFTQISG